MIDIPCEQEIPAMMEEIRENPPDFRFAAQGKGNGATHFTRAAPYPAYKLPYLALSDAKPLFYRVFPHSHISFEVFFKEYRFLY